MEPLHLHGGVALLENMALIVGGASTGEGEFDLGETIFEVDRQRNQCQPVLFELAGEAVDLKAMEKEAPSALWAEGAKTSGLGIARDVHLEQEDLAALNACIGIAQLHAACSKRFYLSPHQLDSGLE